MAKKQDIENEKKAILARIAEKIAMRNAQEELEASPCSHRAHNSSKSSHGSHGSVRRGSH